MASSGAGEARGDADSDIADRDGVDGGIERGGVWQRDGDDGRMSEELLRRHWPTRLYYSPAFPSRERRTRC